MGFFSFIGVAGTAGTLVIFGQAIWDPVELGARVDGPVGHGVALLGLGLGELGPNIAPNGGRPAHRLSCRVPVADRTCARLPAGVGRGDYRHPCANHPQARS